MVARDVVELDAIVVDSVQDAQAGLSALAVVRLGLPVTARVKREFGRYKQSLF